jgi:hypothetical protein
MGDPYDYNYAEIVVGKASQEPRVSFFDAQQPTVVSRGTFLTFPTGSGQGVNVVAGSTDAQRGAEIYVNLKGTARIRIFRGVALLGEINPTSLFKPQALPGTVHSVNMAIGRGDDDFFDIYNPSDLSVVWGDGPFNQVPVVYTGAFNKPAGFNCGNPAA